MNLPFFGETFFCPEKAGTWIPRNRGRTTLFYLVGKPSGVLLLHICVLTVYNWIYTLLFYNRTNSSYVTNVKSYLYILILHTLNQ